MAVVTFSECSCFRQDVNPDILSRELLPAHKPPNWVTVSLSGTTYTISERCSFSHGDEDDDIIVSKVFVIRKTFRFHRAYSWFRRISPGYPG